MRLFEPCLLGHGSKGYSVKAVSAAILGNISMYMLGFCVILGQSLCDTVYQKNMQLREK